MPHFEASELGCHCSHNTPKWVAGLKSVNGIVNPLYNDSICFQIFCFKTQFAVINNRNFRIKMYFVIGHLFRLKIKKKKNTPKIEPSCKTNLDS